MAKVGILAIGIGLFVLICLFIWPTLALVAFMSINMIKAHLYAFRGFWGYLFDVGMVIIAIFSMSRCIFTKDHIEGRLVPPTVWLCMLMLAMWAWFRLPATREPELGKIKVLIFSIFDMLVFSLGILSGRTKTGLKIVCRAMIMVGIISVIGILGFGQQSAEWEGSRITLGQTNPLAPIDMIAYSLIALAGIWAARRTKKQFLLMLAMGVASLIAIVRTGTRGIIVVLPVVFLLLAYYYRRRINFSTVLVSALLALLTLWMFNYLIESGKGLAGQGGRFSAEQFLEGFMDRVIMIKTALDGWARSPFLGTGPGDFAFQMKGFVYMKYPHNILLEVLNELGLVGFSLYSFLLFYGFRSAKLLSAPWLEYTEYKRYSVIIFSAFIYHFIIGFKSGGYAGSNMFYFFWGASVSMFQLASSEPNKIYEEEYAYEDEYEYKDIEIGEFVY